ncbi:adhesion G-protein coupled receptor G2 isoform X2 [Lates calcarifer]|uniref:Adhesion G-protein coupled receptor G2 n=1 Tax=Lates calcarifer TaxID=8187 RepID=A0AAJ8DXB2_LATCA|nr:adhesion G-protein coupled receptor G2 isoform X2 [Lates calcarifer]
MFVSKIGFYPREAMPNENEDKVMKACHICSRASSCQHTFAPSARMKKPGSYVRDLHWLHILLVVILSGQASCNHTSTAPSSTLPLPTTTAQTSVNYFLEVTVDVTGVTKNESEIKEWLNQVFQNRLGSCVSPTTATPTSPQTTSVSTSNETTFMTIVATTLQDNNTTTASTSTMFKSNNTTTATASTSTMFKSNNTTTATATTSTTPTSKTTTTVPTSTTLKNKKTTTATTITTLAAKKNNSLPSNGGKNTPANGTNPNQPNKQRVARQISNNVTQTSDLSDKTTDLLQGIEVSCIKKTAILNTKCSVMLQLRQEVPPCCILRTLCAASKTSSDIYVVGKKADRGIPLQNECNNKPQVDNSCTYTGPASASCEESGAAYVADQSNSTNCSRPDAATNNCSCSAYCSRDDSYYTFQMSIQDPKMNFSYVLSLMSKLKQAPECSPSPDSACPLSIIASEYKDANMTCVGTTTNLGSCKVILGFNVKVPICTVAAAVANVLQPEKQISYDGRVTQAAICENSEVSGNPLKFPLTWVVMNLTPATFCMTIKETDILTCQNGNNVVVKLEQHCVYELSPNVTTIQPNATASSANVTSPPLNTTAAPLNATTAAANITVTATLNTTTTTANASISVTPTTTESAESQANALLELTRDMSKLNSSQINQLVSQLENLLSGPTVSLALGNISVHIVSNLLGASPEKLADSSNRIIGIVDTVGLKLVLEDKPETLLSSAVALSVKPADGTNFQETFFSISDPSNVQVRGDPRPRRSSRAHSSVPQGSIRLPPTLTQDLSSEEQQQASRVQFNFYQRSTVFQDRSLGQRKLNSGILGASVANLSISGLKDDVVIHLRNNEPVPANFVATCVFWDFTRNNGSGGWNPNGCSVQNSTDNETICGCDHLTSFAILLDLSRKPVTNRVQATILTFITYIGCGISAIFLSITLLTYLAFGKLRKDIPSKILIQLCLALLLLNLVFLVDAWLALYPEAVGLCISTAWFLHYFLLVTFTWMGLEAVHMYLALVKVFNSYVSRYMLKFSLVGWGIPMIVVIIVIAINRDNYGLVSYGKFPDGTSDDFCWLKNDIAFYVAVVAYFCVIFLFNLIMFIVVLVQLCRIKRQNPHNVQHRSTMQDVRSVMGITILLGLTWGFAFFAWGPVNLPFMYLFAIFNSLQGFFIFVFHCAVKENVRRQWRVYLCCGRMRLAENSEWSRTATQKTVKKSSVTRLTSLHSSKSSQSNNSSGSTSCLVSDSSEQINGISSPFEDRTITADEDPSMDVILNEINRQYRTQQAP